MKPIIFYGVAGEGLGHASRVLSIIDALPEYEVHVFTFGKAHKFFLDSGYPYLHEIEGIMFGYSGSRVSYPKTLWRFLKHRYSGCKRNIELITKLDKELNPSLYVTDFEPSIPRAARKLGKKFFSVDNQHRFIHFKMPELPMYLRLYGWATGLVTRTMIPKANETIISVFHHDEEDEQSFKHVHLTGGLIRKGICLTETYDNDFVLVYLRKSISNDILKTLQNINKECRIYGATETDLKKELEQKENFVFFDPSPSFMCDLANCSCVISTAGNQLISECRYLQKPIFCVPEPFQLEQDVNSHYVEKIGLGKRSYLRNLNEESVVDFIENFQPSSTPASNGVNKVIEIFKQEIERG